MEYQVERVRAIVRVRQGSFQPDDQAAIPDDHPGSVVVTTDRDANIVRIRARNGKDTIEYVFDAVFDQESKQHSIYSYIGQFIGGVTEGLNTTVFAYGQTGSGKTHTMLGAAMERSLLAGSSFDSEESSTPESDWGVIPRAVYDLFTQLNRDSNGGRMKVLCSYMQIYQDRLYDLLTDGKMKHPLPLREGISDINEEGVVIPSTASKANYESGVYVPGLSQFRVSSTSDVLGLLSRGAHNRAERSTEYNLQSSRSHALLQLHIEVEGNLNNSSRSVSDRSKILEESSDGQFMEGSQDKDMVQLRRAKLTLVDLAGSEKWSDGAAGSKDMTKELTSINTSLSALGNCIAALAERGRRHVPFRDSTLTRLLQDSLGGNTKTVVIATVSPHLTSLEETSSTLAFATRASKIMAKVKSNQVMSESALLSLARKEIATLKQQLKTTSVAMSTAPVKQPITRSRKSNRIRLKNNTSKVPNNCEENEELSEEQLSSGVQEDLKSRNMLEQEVIRLKKIIFDLEGQLCTYTKEDTAFAPSSPKVSIELPQGPPSHDNPSTSPSRSTPHNEASSPPLNISNAHSISKTRDRGLAGNIHSSQQPPSPTLSSPSKCPPIKFGSPTSCRHITSSQTPNHDTMTVSAEDRTQCFGKELIKPEAVSMLNLTSLSQTARSPQTIDAVYRKQSNLKKQDPDLPMNGDKKNGGDDASCFDTNENLSDEVDTSSDRSVNTSIDADSLVAVYHASDQVKPKVAYELECIAKALYEFEGEESGDLSFKSGELLVITERCDSGWWKGYPYQLPDIENIEKEERTDVKVGTFPCHYVEVLDEDTTQRLFTENPVFSHEEPNTKISTLPAIPKSCSHAMAPQPTASKSKAMVISPPAKPLSQPVFDISNKSPGPPEDEVTLQHSHNPLLQCLSKETSSETNVNAPVMLDANSVKQRQASIVSSSIDLLNDSHSDDEIDSEDDEYEHDRSGVNHALHVLRESAKRMAEVEREKTAMVTHELEGLGSQSKKPKKTHWKDLIWSGDSDGSGVVCLQEFYHLVRVKLKIDQVHILDKDIALLFHMLEKLNDDGDDDEIELSALIFAMEKAPTPTTKKKPKDSVQAHKEDTSIHVNRKTETPSIAHSARHGHSSKSVDNTLSNKGKKSFSRQNLQGSDRNRMVMQSTESIPQNRQTPPRKEINQRKRNSKQMRNKSMKPKSVGNDSSRNAKVARAGMKLTKNVRLNTNVRSGSEGSDRKLGRAHKMIQEAEVISSNTRKIEKSLEHSVNRVSKNSVVKEMAGPEIDHGVKYIEGKVVNHRKDSQHDGLLGSMKTVKSQNKQADTTLKMGKFAKSPLLSKLSINPKRVTNQSKKQLPNIDSLKAKKPKDQPKREPRTKQTTAETCSAEKKKISSIRQPTDQRPQHKQESKQSKIIWLEDGESADDDSIQAIKHHIEQSLQDNQLDSDSLHSKTRGQQKHELMIPESSDSPAVSSKSSTSSVVKFPIISSGTKKQPSDSRNEFLIESSSGNRNNTSSEHRTKVSADNDRCSRHNLESCVLCKLVANPGTAASNIKPATSLTSATTDTGNRCERHGLTECVLCSDSKSHKESSLSIKTQPPFSTAPSLMQPRGPCSRHGLEDCFLCSISVSSIDHEPHGGTHRQKDTEHIPTVAMKKMELLHNDSDESSEADEEEYAKYALASSNQDQRNTGLARKSSSLSPYKKGKHSKGGKSIVYKANRSPTN